MPSPTNCGANYNLIYNTAATLLLGTLVPALFIATTRYSRLAPRG